jgi:AraC-like DNA-binding protein
VQLSESFLKENVNARIFEEFPFLLSETVLPKVLPPTVFAEFDQLCQQILTEYTSDSLYRYQIIGSLFGVVLLKIKAHFWQDYDAIYEGDRSSQIVKEFKQYLEQHFRGLDQGKAPKILRVQDCAAQLNLHPNYLSIVLKSKTGRSVSTWITEKTIGEAKLTLQYTSLPVNEIAYQLGYTESAHFSTFFKKHTNQSPNAYRRQHDLS